MPSEVAYYFSFQSPWSYLGHADILAVAKKHAIALSYRPIPLARLFPETGGLPLAKRHPVRQSYRLIELQRWRDKKQLKLHLHPKFWPFDAKLVDRVAAILALEGLPLEPFVTQGFAAVFANEQNLADERDLAALLASAGLPADDLIAAAKSAKGEAVYEANLEAALAHGVFGAPSYVLGGEVFWGQDRVDFLDEALASGRDAYRGDI